MCDRITAKRCDDFLCPDPLPAGFRIGHVRRSDTPRGLLLDEAKHLIEGDRNNQYGPPTQDFTRSSDMMTAAGYRHTSLPASAPPCKECGAKPLRSHDTAILVTTIKISRLMWSPEKRDHWADVAGYAACGWECAIDHDSPQEPRDAHSVD